MGVYKIERFIYVDTFIGYMFLDVRKHGKNVKYYLAHSYRVGDKVKRISRYLGSNLSEEKLEKLRQRAEQLILQQTKERSIFEFELSKKEIKEYKRYDSRVAIEHFQKKLNWKEFTEEFTYNTNAIEGSTLAYSDVKKIIEKREMPSNADELEAIGVPRAVSYIKTTNEKLSVELIKKLHFLCFEKTKYFAGQLRDVDVVIRNRYGDIVHRGAPRKDVEKLLNNLVGWYGKHKNRYPPLLLAALMHNEFENIHPFQDGNGRVGRLLLNYILIKHNYPPLNIRFGDRQAYYGILQQFEKKNNIKPTLQFFISQYRKQYRG